MIMSEAPQYIGPASAYHAVLHHAPVAFVEAVHAGVALAGWAAAQEVHLAWCWQGLPHFRRHPLCFLPCLTMQVKNLALMPVTHWS